MNASYFSFLFVCHHYFICTLYIILDTKVFSPSTQTALSTKEHLTSFPLKRKVYRVCPHQVDQVQREYMNTAGHRGQRTDDGGQDAETTGTEQKVLGRQSQNPTKPYSYGLTADLTHVHFLWPSPPPYLQLMPDRVAVSIQVQDQGVLLSDGAGVVGHTAHAQTALHLHTFVKQWLKTHPPATPVTQQTWLVRGCLPGRSAWTSPSVRSDRRASSRPDWGWRKPQTAAWRATPVDGFTLTVNAAQNANANTQTAWLHFVALYLWHDVMRLKSESLPTPALVLASTLWTFRNYLILGIDSKTMMVQ